MHDQPTPAGQRDLRAQSVVLSNVLDLHPAHKPIPDLIRDLSEDADDAYVRAIRDLTYAGLLRCPGGVVEPTEAAVRFELLSL